METEIPFSKILRPTQEEFNDFAAYVDKLEKISGGGYGLYKIVPPKKWKPGKIDYEAELEDFVVSSPIEQNVFGKGGIYELLLIQKKSMRVHDYRKKIETFDRVTEGKPVEDVEDLFWRNIAFSPPLYGADIKGSLFDEGVAWDLKNLPGVLSDGLKKKISGVNEPYLYFGSWKTMFAWHKEDMDLYSINYLHHGKPKFWYSLPREETPKLEAYAKQQFPEAFSKCKEYMRHKTIMISPYVLKAKIPDLKINKMIQYPGEFIITVGGAYHCGFNWGFNMAEAVNFAASKWLDILPFANPCTCTNDSVKIDKQEFLKNYALTKKPLKSPATKGNSKKNLMEIEEEGKSKMESDKISSSTKATRKSSEEHVMGGRCGFHFIDTHQTRKITDAKNDAKGKLIDKSSPRRLRKTAASKNILTHPILQKKRTYEPKHLKERNQKDKDHEISKVLQGSKKIRKQSISPKSKSQKNSVEKELPGKRENSQENHRRMRSDSTPGDNEHLKKIRKLVKAGDHEEVLVENWFQCDECTKWRKIIDEALWKKVQSKGKLSCKSVPGLACKSPEENWRQSYFTISEREKAKVV